MKLILQDDYGKELARLDCVEAGYLESANAATGSVRLTTNAQFLLAKMLYDAGSRPDRSVIPQLKDNVRMFGKKE